MLLRGYLRVVFWFVVLGRGGGVSGRARETAGILLCRACTSHNAVLETVSPVKDRLLEHHVC